MAEATVILADQFFIEWVLSGQMLSFCSLSCGTGRSVRLMKSRIEPLLLETKENDGNIDSLLERDRIEFWAPLSSQAIAVMPASGCLRRIRQNSGER